MAALPTAASPSPPRCRPPAPARAPHPPRPRSGPLPLALLLVWAPSLALAAPTSPPPSAPANNTAVPPAPPSRGPPLPRRPRARPSPHRQPSRRSPPSLAPRVSRHTRRSSSPSLSLAVAAATCCCPRSALTLSWVLQFFRPGVPPIAYTSQPLFFQAALTTALQYLAHIPGAPATLSFYALHSTLLSVACLRGLGEQLRSRIVSSVSRASLRRRAPAGLCAPAPFLS
ncbi:hypothetical protein AB1Y20_022529 [Prymnesium parvum]|uniref:Uncharacterized protein n=1 Tax=Prymnesium parvum TaxID=97485 RepID=A0AB34JGJ9_PRYPA